MRARQVISVALGLSILAQAETGYAPLGTYTAAERRHWAFQKRGEPAIPKFANAAQQRWAAMPIDAFVLAKLQAEGLKPAAEADKATLIRRVTFDLIGLPPTPVEVREFITDRSPNAYEKVVDRLLASPHYGERWGQHWLDVVRFSETDGFEYDAHRNGAWRFRDYVIDSLNADKPYNRFLTEQLAGDELNPNDDTLRIASGYPRLGPLRKNAGNQEVASSRNEVLTEMTNSVGAALLGVTLGCARCHDHKFDPIRQSDYYRIQSYFSATWEKDVTRATSEEEAGWKAKKDAVDGEMKALKAKMRSLKGDERKAMEQKLADAEAKMPEPLPALYGVHNDVAKTSPIHLLARGDYQNKGARVGMRPLGVLLPDAAPERTAMPENPRTRLAEWITDPENPLPSRVMANRLWLGHFGRGIVGTPNDFGRMGQRPSHPELLDWLANQLVAGGWKLKALHRMMVLSNTYKQASDSAIAALGEEKDPENKLLWKHSRRRLEAEEIRDAMIAASGALNPKRGGPGVMVPVDSELPALLYKPSQWQPPADAA